MITCEGGSGAQEDIGEGGRQGQADSWGLRETERQWS